jgi:4-hydroxy-3-polyprenylbenzoate decarboxylase
MKKPVIVGITGASGAIYGARIIGRLLETGIQAHLILSDNGKKLVEHELGFVPDVENIIEYCSKTLKTPLSKKLITILDNDDLSSSPASGNSSYDIMMVVPCSMNTLSSIANGRASSLIERAADVFLKERRKLILVPRETPLSIIHLRNMLTVTEAGGIVLPAMPAYYFKPFKIEELADFIAAKIFNISGIPAGFIKLWNETESGER